MFQETGKIRPLKNHNISETCKSPVDPYGNYKIELFYLKFLIL